MEGSRFCALLNVPAGTTTLSTYQVQQPPGQRAGLTGSPLVGFAAGPLLAVSLVGCVLGTAVGVWWAGRIARGWHLAYTVQNGLDLGQPYTVPGYPTGLNTAPGGTEGPWSPATDDRA